MKRVKKKRTPKARDRFKDQRESLNITQKKMAQDLDITELTVRNVEKGNKDPSSFMCFLYAAYLGVSVYELFTDMAEDAAAIVKSLKFQHQHNSL